MESIFILEYCKFHSNSGNHEMLETLISDLIFWNEILKHFAEKAVVENRDEIQTILSNLLGATLQLDLSEEVGRRQIIQLINQSFLTWESIVSEKWDFPVVKNAAQLLMRIGDFCDFMKMLTRKLVTTREQFDYGKDSMLPAWNLISYIIECDIEQREEYEKIFHFGLHTWHNSRNCDAIVTKVIYLIAIGHKDLGVRYFDDIVGKEISGMVDSQESVLKLQYIFDWIIVHGTSALSESQVFMP